MCKTNIFFKQKEFFVENTVDYYFCEIFTVIKIMVENKAKEIKQMFLRIFVCMNYEDMYICIM